MKYLKRTFVAFVGLLTVGALASCNKKTEDPYDVEAAAKRIQMIEDKSVSVVTDLTVPRTVVLDDVTYNVTWSSNNDYAVIKEIANDETKYTVGIDYVHNQTEAQKVTLTATVSVEGSDKTVSKTFYFEIPKFEPISMAAADKAKDKELLALKGTIVTKEAYSEKYGNTNVYLMCDDGGFEAYKLTCTKEQYEKELTQGTSIYVYGPKSYYNGLRETSPSAYAVVPNAEKVTLTAEDLTEAVLSGDGITTAKQCHLAKLTDIEVVSVGEQDSSGQYSIIVGDETDTKKQATIRISKYFAAKDSDLWNEYTGITLVPGQKVTVTGFVGWYNGAQITPFESGQIVPGEMNYVKQLGKTLIAKTQLPAKVYGSKVLVLPSTLIQAGLSGEQFDNFEIEWTKESENVSFGTKNVAKVEGKAATDTTPAVEEVPAYTTKTVVTTLVTEDEEVTLTLNIKDKTTGDVLFTSSVKTTLVKEIITDSHATVIATEKDEEVTVAGTIAYFSKKSKTASGVTTELATFTVVDADGAYLIYELPISDNNKDQLVVGKKVAVTGKIDIYKNLIEIKDASILNAEDGTVVEPVEITELPTVTPELQSKYVTLTGKVKSSGQSFVVTVGEGDAAKDIACKVISTSTYNNNPGMVPPAGSNVTVKGILAVENSVSQVALYMENDVVDNTTDAQKLEIAINAIKAQFASRYENKSTITLKNSYKDQKIELKSDSSTEVTLDKTNNVVKIVPTATEATYELKFVVTLVEGQPSEEITVSFTIQLPQDGSVFVTASYTGTTTTNMTEDAAANATAINLPSSIFEVTSIKNDASGHIGLNKTAPKTIRIYNKADSTNGEALKIAVKSGYTIISVEYVLATSNASNAYTVTNSTATLTATEGVYTVNDSEVTIKNTDTPNNQLHILEIIVRYKATA